MKDVLIGIGISIGIAIVVVVIQVISGYLKSAMEAKKQEAIANQNLAAANAWDTAIKVIDTVTKATVATIEQDVAKDLRQAVKEGKADREKLLQLSENAYNSILAQVKPEVVQILQEHVADYQTYIENRIEQAVLEVKK